jgi:ribonuclease Z
MVKSLEKGSVASGNQKRAAIMHDIQDYHISPEEAADLANQRQLKLLALYHLLPSPDGLLPRRAFSQGVASVRRADWVIADDGSLYTLPIGSSEVRIGRMPS